MNNEPVNISTFISAVSSPIATKAPRQADSPMTIGAVLDPDSSPTTCKPLNGRQLPALAALPFLLPAGRTPSRAWLAGFPVNSRMEAEIVRSQVGQDHVRQNDALEFVDVDMHVIANLMTGMQHGIGVLEDRCREVQRILVGSAVTESDDVVAETLVEHVRIGTGTAAHDVITSFADDDVITAASEDGVDAAASLQKVGRPVTGN